MEVVLVVAILLRGATHSAKEVSEIGKELLDPDRAIELVHAGKPAENFAGVASSQEVDLDALLVHGDERQAECKRTKERTR